MEKTEKSILRAIYLVTVLMFSMLSLSLLGSGRQLDVVQLLLPIIVGIVSCILIAYGHFIIKKFFPAGDKYLLIISSFITQFGLVMIYRIDIAKNQRFAMKQITWFTFGMGVFIFLVVFLPEIKKFSRFKYAYIIAAIALLALPLVMGSEIKGSKNWILIAGISFQPSEIAKLLLILYLSSVLQEIENFKDVIKIALPVFACIGILVIEKDLGASLLFFGIFMTMLYIGTSNLKYILSGLGIFSVGGVLSYFAFGHIRKRFKIWWDPWPYKSGDSYQIVQSLFGIAAGGLFGTGIGWGHPDIIPLSHSDLIFSAISEELGLLGAMALILLYLILVYRGLRTAMHAPDDYSRLVAVGISGMIAFQAFVIIGGVTKMIPLTGITLPFVSYGGTSLLLNFIFLGILQKISESGRDSIE